MLPNPEINILAHSVELAPYFKSINEEWISDLFVIESGDLSSLDHPKTQIIDRGGKIWYARHSQLGIVGTCALLKKDANNFELTKMGVLTKARGLKIGEHLLQHVLADAAAMNMDMLFLLTNKKCAAAIHLYEKNGFVHDSEIMTRYGSLYQRCNVAMRYIGV